MVFEVVKAILGIVLPPWQRRRKVRLTMHRAFFSQTGRQCYFMTVTNLSQEKEVEITHVWINGHPQVSAIPPERPLPKRLKPDETWETWIDVAQVQDTREDVFALGRARLS